MIGRYITTISGEEIEEEKVNDIAKKIVALIMSELPKEVQTYDMTIYVLRMAKEKIKGSRIVLQ